MEAEQITGETAAENASEPNVARVEPIEPPAAENASEPNVARVEPIEPNASEPNAANVEPPAITYGHQADGSYLTPYNTTYFYREEFFQSCLAGLIDRAQCIILPEKVDWKTLHETPQFITPHVVIFDDGGEKVPLGDLAGFAARGFQRVMVYSDRIDDYAADYIALVESAIAKVIAVNNVDLFFDTFITSGSAFTVVLVEDLLRDRYGKRMDISADELEETKFFMQGLRFGRDDKEAVERFLKIAAAGYRMGDKRAEMIIRGQALMDSLHYYARVLAQTALTKTTPRGGVLVVWINTFLLKTLRKPLLEQLIMRAADSDTDFDFALCLHPINDKISVNAMALAEKTIPAYGTTEMSAGVLTPAEFAAWWPGILTAVPCVIDEPENNEAIKDSSAENSDGAAEIEAE